MLQLLQTAWSWGLYEKIQQIYENLAQSLNFRLLFVGTEAKFDSGLFLCHTGFQQNGACAYSTTVVL